MKAATKQSESRKQERTEFAKKLTSLLIQGKPVIFADETSWSTWDKHSIGKTWQHSDEPITHTKNTQRLSSVTIYGCVSNCLNGLYFMTWSSTN